MKCDSSSVGMKTVNNMFVEVKMDSLDFIYSLFAPPGYRTGYIWQGRWEESDERQRNIKKLHIRAD